MYKKGENLVKIHFLEQHEFLNFCIKVFMIYCSGKKMDNLSIRTSTENETCQNKVKLWKMK